METKLFDSARCRRPGLIEFTSNGFESHAFVAEDRNAGFDVPASRRFIGFGWDCHGMSPTAVFEPLARFVWETLHRDMPFSSILWFNVDRSPLDSFDSQDEAALIIQCVRLEGYAERRSWRTLWRTVRVDGAPGKGDRCVVEGPEHGRTPKWEPSVSLHRLTPAFQQSVRERIIQPVPASRMTKVAA